MHSDKNLIHVITSEKKTAGSEVAAVKLASSWHTLRPISLENELLVYKIILEPACGSMAVVMVWHHYGVLCQGYRYK